MNKICVVIKLFCAARISITKFVITFEAENLFSESNYFFVNEARTQHRSEEISFNLFTSITIVLISTHAYWIKKAHTNNTNAVFDLDKCFLVLCFRKSLMIFIEAVFSSNGWRRGIWINLGGLKLKRKVRRRFKRDPGGWIYVIWKRTWRINFGKVDVILKWFEFG